MSKKSSNNKLLLIAGVAAVGYYMYSKGYFNSLTGTPAVAPVINPVLPQGAPQTSGIQIGVQTAQQPILAPVPSNDPRVQTITQWMNTLTGGNKTAAFAALTVMTQDEIAGLYDIVANDFYGNGITTAAQTAFWNAWRVKYHVNDGTYTN
jgi:hypothetical protein